MTHRLSTLFTANTPPLEAALAYAALGWPVFPLHTPEPMQMAVSGQGIISGLFCSCARGRRGEECPQCGKHPRFDKELLPNGKTSASTDPDVITRWWAAWPRANIGVCAGLQSMLVIVDVDPKHNGFSSLAALQEKYGALPDTLTAITGSGGKHLLFQHPGIEPLSGGANKFGDEFPGVDVKADDGYIVAAPSLHKSGNRYQWENPGTPIAPLPEWMLEYLQPADKKKSRSKRTSHNADAPLEERLVNGARNNTLFRELCALRARGASDAAVRAAGHSLNVEMCQPPLSPDEVEKIVESVNTRYARGKDYPCTDLGNAERLRDLYGNNIRWCEDAGGWFLWTGTHWRHDKSAAIRTYAYYTARAILREAADATSPDARDTLIVWARKSEMRRSTEAMIEQVKPMVAIEPEAFDSDPWLLNCQNGTLDLRTGELRDHDPAMNLRKIVPVDYDHTAKADNWLHFLFEIFEENIELISFVQRAVGYTLTGDVSMQCLFFLYGGGQNGKSTFIETLAELLGTYQCKFPNKLLVKSRFEDPSAPSPDVADLHGIRFAHASEIERGSHMAESRVKDLTGGDTIVARYLRANFFRFRPTHKLWMYGNDKPVIKGVDEGIWRRIFLIPFLYKIPAEKRQPDFFEACLRPELPGILNWAVDGCRDWLERGRKLDPPEVVMAATREYRAEMDYFGEFLTEYCVFGEMYRTKLSELYQAYKQWAQDNGDTHVMSSNAFGKELVRRGCTRQHTMTGKVYCGIGLRETLDYGDEGQVDEIGYQRR